jgi:hypothetical protein
MEGCSRQAAAISGGRRLCGDRLTGLRRPYRNNSVRTALALINMLPPLHQDIGDFLLSSPSHVDCACYLGEESWTEHFNDRLYVAGKPTPVWTHLQVRKADILSRWPRPTPTTNSESACRRWLAEQMRQSPTIRVKSKAAFRTEACRKFSGLGIRQFERAWNDAIAESGATAWRKAGRPTMRRSKSNHHTN